MTDIYKIIIGLFVLTKLSESASFFDLLKSYGPTSSYDVPSRRSPTRKEYDFIVVGAGSGGSAVTNRLSENPNWNVLLVEAGKDEGLFNQIPVIADAFQFTDYNWGYTVEPSRNACLGMKDGRCTWPRGKCLGGSSVLNNMIHTRGNRMDFDRWAAMGNPGWSFNDVLPYFKKSERYRIPGPFDATYHNRNGNVCVENAPWRTPLAKAFLDAGKALGFNITDINGPQQIGFSYVPLNQDQGARCSASKAYLRIKRPNLDIVTRALVLRVLIDSNNEAYGIEYESNGQKHQVFAKKEVIVSAGTIDSAKLLMLSGIGPKEHLEDLGIPVIKDAKVGYNLQEHLAFWGITYTVKNAELILLRRIITQSPKILLQYGLRREGLLSNPGGPESIAFLQTKYANDSRPDLEILLAATALNGDNGLIIRRSYGVSDRSYNGAFKPIEGIDTFTIWPVLQHPKSRGWIKLKSKNPYDKPLLYGNFFDHPLDVEIILEGIKFTIKLINTEPFKKFQPRINDLKVPGCDKLDFGTDDYWRCAIRHIPATENHECGTVKMGPPSDSNAVVDPELRVYGVKRLRVADASIIPEIPVGHINANVYMIGEKAADMIKATWRNR